MEDTQKTCTRCKVTRPITDFFVNSNYRDGHTHWCKPCVGANSASLTAHARLDALEVLGGTCKDCGITDLRVLVIDHRGGGGVADRKKHGSALRFYRHVAAQPETYQALCHNCNHLKRLDKREFRKGAYSEIRATLPPFEHHGRSQGQKLAWEDPEYRKARVEDMSQAWTEERRAKLADKTQQRARRLIETADAARENADRGEWGGGYAACLACGRDDRRYKSQGMCDTCYAYIRRAAKAARPVDAGGQPAE